MSVGGRSWWLLRNSSEPQKRNRYFTISYLSARKLAQHISRDIMTGHIEDDAMSGDTTITITMDKIESQVSVPKIEEPAQPKQKYKISPRIVSDAILGLSDGLTVPFALTAGLSAIGTSRLVVLGGLAELMAGAISMGLGGFVGAKSEA